ncbi:MAG TPA: molybdopterin cofactor-binding domain-containing protein [Xanthobacteraceae bacterium]
MAVTRRELLQSGIAAGIAFRINLIGRDAHAVQAGTSAEHIADAFDADGKLRWRTDALAKVTGQKIFSRDFRARDLPGWPKEQSHAFLIHAAAADRTFEGVDLAVLGNELQPDRLVTAEDLQRDRLTPHRPGFYGDFFLVPKGTTARLLGQPVALLIYHNFARYDAAKRRIRFNTTTVRYGAVTGPKPPPHYGAARFVRVQADEPDPEGRHAPILDATIFGKFDGDKVVWPAADRGGPPPAKGMAAALEIERDIASADEDAVVLKRQYFSQSIDACAMEADNGNVWYDQASATLHVLVSTQSPYEGATGAAEMLAHTNFRVDQIDFSIGHTVGYGTKDQSVFPYFCILAGLYGERRPVRLANDRFEQFQMGMKQHSFRMDNTLVADRRSGKFRIVKAEFKMDGGGRANVSANVGMAGTSQALSIYHVPKSDLSFAALASRAVEAGSTRGYGSLQTIMGIELLVDEAAEALGIDPIELRLRNLSTVGTKVAEDEPQVRNHEMLLKAQSHPLWKDRAARKLKFEAENPGRKYGVGFAHVQRGYGNLAQAALATLAFDAQGRLSLRQIGNEIGVGLTTSQAVMVKDILGCTPERASFGALDWPEMPLVSDNNPNAMPAEKEAERKANPRWTPLFTAGMSASNGVYFVGHATREAARALLAFGLKPAAIALWKREGIGLAPAPADIGVVKGALAASGRTPLPIPRVAAAAHEMGLITGVSVHVFNRRRAQWAEAEFDIPTVGRERLKVDALSVQYGSGGPNELRRLMTSGGFHFIERADVFYPPMRNIVGFNYVSSIGNVVEVAVEMSAGNVELLSHHSILDCGTQVVPQLVSGQLQGGLSMGIGHALHEYLPLYEDGPGDGTWNWHRYRLPRASDVAVWKQTADILAPRSEKDPPKGMAEVVTIAIIPAIANAVAHAIGRRFYEMPITPDKIRVALQ